MSVQTNGDAPVTSCADLSDRMTGPSDCEESEDGTILASGVGEAFSDDNLSGSTVMAQSVNPGTGRVVFALYETYAKRAALDPATLSAIVSDKRLAALTDPTTNEAGAGLDVEAAGVTLAAATVARCPTPEGGVLATSLSQSHGQGQGQGQGRAGAGAGAGQSTLQP